MSIRLARDSNLVTVLQENLDERQRWGDFFERLFITLEDWKAIGPAHLAGSAVAGLLGLILGFIFLQRYLTRWASFKIATNGKARICGPNGHHDQEGKASAASKARRSLCYTHSPLAPVM